MSVINQVLNQLEQRGEHAPPEQTMVRPVHRDRRSFMLPLLALLLVLAGGFGAWQWMQMRKSGAAGTAPLPQQAVAASPAAAPAPAATPIPAPAPQAPALQADAAASAAADAGAAPDTGVTPDADTAAPPPILLPASRLSFELGAIPLPSSLRQSATPPAAEAVPDVAAPGSAPPQPVKPKPAQAAAPKARAASAPPLKQVSAEQRAEAEFREAVAAMQQGHIADAIAGYRAVLRIDAAHDEARQALVALLLESKQGAEAERVLRERLNAQPGHTGFAMLLARLQVEHGALEQALATLEKSLPYADAQADYQAFLAALLQRRNRHKEAITHYQIALQLAPGNGIWLMGYGISLQAAQRADDARDAFRRALESRTLTPELQAYVQQKIKEL